MEGVLAEPLFSPSYEQAQFWVQSKHKTPTDRMITHMVEFRHAEDLLLGYEGNPAEQERILRVMAGLPYFEAKTRTVKHPRRSRPRGPVPRPSSSYATRSSMRPAGVELS